MPKFFIPEIKLGKHRLGRHINHDPRSLRFVVPPAKVDKSVVWPRHIPILDQGNLGSCTGNAETGALGCDPFWPTFDAATQASLNEKMAVKIYSLATTIDPYQGQYPPTDTGSDGLSASKAAKQLNFISGYVWATSLAEAMTLIQNGPFIAGTDWTTNMDKPNSEGIIKDPAGGQVRGGHEYVCRERDADKGLWWFDNSWGGTWGKSGRFAYDDAGLTALLGRGGDLTSSVPLTSPPPVPIPGDPDLVTWWTATKPWATGRTFVAGSKGGVASKACIDLAAKKGL